METETDIFSVKCDMKITKVSFSLSRHSKESNLRTRWIKSNLRRYYEVSSFDRAVSARKVRKEQAIAPVKLRKL